MNLEYFDLVEKVIINDDTLFELRKIIGTRTIGNFKKCGMSSVNMVALNLAGGLLTKICIKYP